MIEAFYIVIIEPIFAVLFALFVLAMIPVSMFVVLVGMQYIGTAILKIFKIEL